jgi:hypothetical protein
VVAGLDLDPGTPGWWAAWLVEPAMITVAALIIIGRSVLWSAGGDVDWRARAVLVGVLWSSVILAIAGHWPGEVSMAAAGAVVAAALGPLGAAATAHLISMFDEYVAAARPWEGVTSLAEMVMERPGAGPRPGRCAHRPGTGRAGSPGARRAAPPRRGPPAR